MKHTNTSVAVMIAAFGCMARAPESPPKVEVGRELSTVAGVSIKRHPGPQPSGGRMYYWGNPGLFKTAAISLTTTLECGSSMAPTRMQGTAHLPEGIFDIEARIDYPDKEIQLVVFDAIGAAFKLRISLKTQESDVLVLTTTNRWAKKGFKENKESDGGGSYFGGQFSNMNMDEIASLLEIATNSPVVNETKLPGRFEGEFAYPAEPNMVPTLQKSLQKSLARHGLALTRATRPIEMLVIEPLKK